MPNKTQRIDILLIEKDFFSTRARAQAEVMAGNVLVNGQVAQKPSQNVPDDARIEIKEKSPYVSRGAYKLKKALEEFKINAEGKTCLDAGVSTGGFTQVLLEQKAKKIIAVDVGYGQFDYKLRQDKRIELFERTNIRYLDPTTVEKADLVVADLSFISITKVADNLLALSKPTAQYVFLIKPQFEAEPKMVKKGVVRDPEVHKAVLLDVITKLSKKGFVLIGLTLSPIKGPKGNIEFLAYFKREGGAASKTDINSFINALAIESESK